MEKKKLGSKEIWAYWRIATNRAFTSAWDDSGMRIIVISLGLIFTLTALAGLAAAFSIIPIPLFSFQIDKTMAGLQDFGYSVLVLIVLFLAMLWRTPADMEQEKILEIKELSLRLENELTKRNALPLLEILRDETRTDYLLFNVRNIDPRNLDLEECRINFKELKILFGKKGGKFNEKNGFSFSWEDKIIPHPESPWPGAPTCLKTVKFKDFEILKISHQVNHDMKSSAHFWVEFCDCSGKYDKGVDCEEIDANHSIIEIDIVIELLAKFGDRNIVYPFSRRIRFEKVLNTISEEGITVYDSFDFHIYDF